MAVYVVQESPGKNLLSARQYGEIELLMENQVYQVGLERSKETKGVVHKFYERLREFGDGDYILPLGDPALIGLACAVAADVNGGKFKMLKWDRQEKLYYPVSLNLYER